MGLVGEHAIGSHFVGYKEEVEELEEMSEREKSGILSPKGFLRVRS